MAERVRPRHLDHPSIICGNGKQPVETPRKEQYQCSWLTVAEGHSPRHLSAHTDVGTGPKTFSSCRCMAHSNRLLIIF